MKQLKKKQKENPKKNPPSQGGETVSSASQELVWKIDVK